MDPFGRNDPAEPQKSHRRKKGNQVADRIAVIGQIDPILVQARGGILGAHNIAGHRNAEEDPHAKQAHPGKELDHGQLLHATRHLAKGIQNLGNSAQVGFGFMGGGGIFPGRQNRPEDGQKKDHGSDRKGYVYRLGNGLSGSGHGTHAEVVSEPARQLGRNDGPGPDKNGLHGKTHSPLLFWQKIRHEGPERLHADVRRGIQDPEKACGHPERPGMWHQQESEGGKNGSQQKIRPPSAQHRMPGSIAHRADHRLNDEAGQRGRQPEERQLALLGPEILVDRGHVPHLEAPAKLDPEKSERHVPDLPKGETGYVHGGIITAPIPQPRRFSFRVSRNRTFRQRWIRWRRNPGRARPPARSRPRSVERKVRAGDQFPW